LETKQLREIHVRSFLRRVLAACEDAGALPPDPHMSWSNPDLDDSSCARRGGAHRTVMRLPAGQLSSTGKH
jgi:hypothetical protein